MPYYYHAGSYGDFLANNVYAILLIPILLLSLWAQAQVSGSFRKYSRTANRRRLTGAYSDKSKAIGFFLVDEETEITVFSSANRAMTFRAAALDIKSSRGTQGVQVMVLRGKHTLIRACKMEDAALSDNGRYRCRPIPAIGAILREEDLPEAQITL